MYGLFPVQYNNAGKRGHGMDLTLTEIRKEEAKMFRV
jgi:hypothetical protein